MARLDEQLGDAHAIECIWGMAGMGKSQLMLEYAHTHLHDYDWLLWVDGGAEPELRTSYASLCNHPLHLQLQREEGEDPDSLACRRVKRFLEETPDRCLLMLDDVEEQQHLVDLMPATGNCHVLITTRKNGGFAYAKGLGLETLAEADAWALVTGGTECRDDCEAAALRQLCTELEFLTLELAVVRGILAKGGMQPSKLVDILRKKGEWSRSPADPGFRNRDVKLGKLFDQSLAAMRRGASGEALELAERMALVGGWFASAVIRTRLLVSAVQKSGHGGSLEELVEMAEDEGVPLLVEYSLATGDARGLRFHGLVQNYMRHRAPDMWRAVLEAVHKEGIVEDDVEHFRVVWNRSLEESHSDALILRSVKFGMALAMFIQLRMSEVKEAVRIVEGCLQKIEARSREPGEGMTYKCERVDPIFSSLVEMLNTFKGHLLNDMGRYTEAEVLFRIRLARSAEVLGDEHPTTLEDRSSLAINLSCQGRLAEAESEQRSVLEARQRVLGPEHRDTLDSRSCLTKILQQLGQHAGFEEELREVLRIRERVLGATDPDTLKSRLDIANLLAKQGRSAEADAELNTLPEMKEHELWAKKVGNEILETIILRHDVRVTLANHHGRRTEVEAEERALLEMLESLKGSDHPHSLSIRSNLASLFAAQGLHAKSELEHRRVLEARVRVLGAEHPDSLRSRYNVASSLNSQGQYAEAEKELREVLEISQRVLRPQHLHILAYRYGLAGVLQAQGHHALAAVEFNALLKILEPLYGAEHPDTLRARYALAIMLQQQGKHEKAEKEHRAILETARRKLGAENPLTLLSHESLANTLHAQGRYKDAEVEHRALQEPMERMLGAEHPTTLKNFHNLARVLHKQGRNEESEAMHRVVLRMRESVLGAEHVDTLCSRHCLAKTLQGQGRHAEAEMEQRAVLEMRTRVLGVEHPETLDTHNALMKTLQEQGKFAEAEMEPRRVLESRERDLGAEHPLSLTIRKQVETVMVEQMEGGCVEVECEITSLSKALPHMAPDPFLARVLNSLAWKMQRGENIGDFSQAEAFARKAVEMERVLEADNVLREYALDTLAVVLQKQGKLEEALGFAQEATGIVNAEGWQGDTQAQAAMRETLSNIEAAIAC